MLREKRRLLRLMQVPDPGGSEGSIVEPTMAGG